tara:strand:- start:338 stop:925 length:588 start_codon:yes stop_codon:yes gene_type:complete
MKFFKSKLKTFLKIIICASFSSMQTSSIIESKAEMIANLSEATLGIESVGSSSLRILNLDRTVFVGECPGVRNKTTEGYFVDYETPVQDDYVVILQNFTRGLSPSNPPSVEKDYDSGRASDKIKFKISNKRNKVYLSMQPGINPIKYQIFDETDRKNKKLVKSGVFMLDVKFVDQVYRRDKEYSSETNSYYCPFF